MHSPELYEIHDRRFRLMTIPNTTLEELCADCRWAEGPLWWGDAGFLSWSDIPNDRMLRWAPGGGVSVFRSPANFANGHTRDRQGRLVSCEHGTRRVTRTEPGGSITVLADRFAGRRLNSPNDVVVQSDGAIWFTDPTYGILSDYEGFKAEPEQDAHGVYRIDPATGALARAVDDFVQPNGLAFSPDESRLYIADSGFSHDESAPRHIRVFDVAADGRLSGGRVFAEIDAGVPDGMRVDTEGNVWSSAGDGVHVLTPEGRLLGKIRLPQAVANLTFGGARRNRLFITATRSLYALFVAATGAQNP
jgi:gluconolactonase